MKVDFSVMDFLNRAEKVYGDRIGIVDEPDQPAPSWGSMTWTQVADKARAQAAALDRMGIGPGERVAMVSHNSARLLTAFYGVSGYGRILVPVNFRLVAEEVQYIVEHSGAQVLMVDPELADAMGPVKAPRKVIIGADTDEEVYLHGVEPRPWTPDEDATGTVNYTIV
jgi:acyl-CoA synthetase (AMP-forming)/AMP-acid ligase II